MFRDLETGSRASKEIFLFLPLLLLVIVLVNHVRLVPPPVKPATVAENEFSGERAVARLEDLLQENRAHVVGTPENDLVRDRIIGQIRAMNIEITEQHSFTCRRSNRVSSISCAYVDNLLVRLPGEVDGPAVALVAHYDSQGAAPGASDAGTAVVTLLEVLRIIKDEAPFRNPVVFLVNEGEEIGLFGARAALDHPYFENVGVVLNFEARGSTGQSLMFETTEPNGWLIGAYQRAIPDPATTSLYFEVYKLLPNDTDLTVFKQAGVPGLNFAYAENVRYYHTPFDSIANLNVASLQHHGDNALALTREFANLDMTAQREGNAVYTDLLRFGMISYPATWAGPIAILLALLLFGLLAENLVRKQLAFKAYGWGVLSVTLLGALSIGISLATVKLAVLLSGSIEPWWADPFPLRISLWIGVYLACCLVALLLARRAGYWGLAYGGWSMLALLGIAVGLTLPGVGILFVLPLFLLVTVLLILRFAPLENRVWWRELLLVLPIILHVLLWTQLVEFMDHALGLGRTLFVVVPLFIAAIAIIPVFAVNESRLLKYFSLGSLGIVLAGIMVTAYSPPYTEEFPQKLRVEYLVEPDEQAAWWLVTGRPNELPAALRELHDFTDQPERLFHSTFGTSFVAPAEFVELPVANFEILDDRVENGQRVVAGRFASSGQSLRHRILIPDAARPLTATINGIKSDFLPGSPFNGMHLFNCATPSCNGVEVELRFESLEAFDFIYREQRLSIPDTARPLQDARGKLGMTNEVGDATFIARTISLPSLQP